MGENPANIQIWCVYFFFVEDGSNGETETEFEDYMDGQNQYIKRESSEAVPGLDLSDPKQLAEFARYVIIIQKIKSLTVLSQCWFWFVFCFGLFLNVCLRVLITPL